MLDYFGNATTGTGIATAALDQPGDEGCAYARGNADWQRRNAAEPGIGQAREAAALARRQNHHHLTAFETGVLLDLGDSATSALTLSSSLVPIS